MGLINQMQNIGMMVDQLPCVNKDLHAKVVTLEKGLAPEIVEARIAEEHEARPSASPFECWNSRCISSKH